MDARDFIRIGMSAERTLVVPPERTVGHFVPHMPMVYATPMMILEMEMTSGDAINKYLQPGWVTLGTEVDIRHLAATPVGAHGADHGAGDRGGAPGDPLRGRSLQRQAPHRRGPPRPRPRQCRGFYEAVGGGLAAYTDLILRSAKRVSKDGPRRMSILRDAAHCAAPQDEAAKPTSPVPSSGGSRRRPRGSAAIACRLLPSALPAPPPWCRRAR